MWHEGCPGEDREVQVSCSTIMGCHVVLCGDLLIVSAWSDSEHLLVPLQAR